MIMMSWFRFPGLLQAASWSPAAANSALLQELVLRGVFEGGGGAHLMCLNGCEGVAGLCIGLQHGVAKRGLVSVLLWVRACELRCLGF